MAAGQTCSGHCESCASREQDENCQLNLAMSRIRRKIVVMSGKGGVGKSTVAVNLAYSLARTGRRVGLLDVDVHGPSIPKMLHLEKACPTMAGNLIVPVEAYTIKVMSVGFMLEHEDDAVIWRGPMKIGVIKQLLSEVEWGELDDLVVDCPPGTGDEPLSVCQMLGEHAGAVVVTTPQQVAAADVAKSLNFCAQLHMPVLGIVENMSGFVCPKCGEITEIFASGAGEALAGRYQVPFAGKLPVDPAVCQDGDQGRPFVQDSENSAAAQAFQKVFEHLLAEIDR